MYRQSMLTAIPSALALMLAVALVGISGVAGAAEGTGGGGDTNAELHKACKIQAKSDKLAQDAKATFVQRCANTPINPAARKAGESLRGIK